MRTLMAGLSGLALFLSTGCGDTRVEVKPTPGPTPVVVEKTTIIDNTRIIEKPVIIEKKTVVVVKPVVVEKTTIVIQEKTP